MDIKVTLRKQAGKGLVKPRDTEPPQIISQSEIFDFAVRWITCLRPGQLCFLHSVMASASDVRNTVRHTPTWDFPEGQSHKQLARGLLHRDHGVGQLGPTWNQLNMLGQHS